MNNLNVLQISAILYSSSSLLRTLGLLASIRRPLGLAQVANSTQITCVQNATATFEDVITCFDNYTVSWGFYTNDTYAAAQPTAEEFSGWEELVTSLLSVDGNCTSVVVPQSIADIYEVTLFTDPEGPQYCVVSESTAVDGVYAKGWGLVAVPATRAAVMRDIHLAAPHPQYDLLTPEQAAALFKSTGARSLLIAGRIRAALLVPSNCVVPTSAALYYQTDPAHQTSELFHPAAEIIRKWQHANGGCPSEKCAFIQLHGKGATSCPTDTMFLTTGLGRSKASIEWYTDSVDRPVKRLKAELLKAFPTWNASLPTDSTCNLIATDNVFGRLLNGVPEQLVCTKGATADLTAGEFVHIEQAIISRESAAYSEWTTALLAAFAPST